MTINKYIFCCSAIALFVPYGIYAYYTVTEKDFVPKTLSDETEDEYANKYGSLFKHHFLSVKDESNKSWWDSVYEKLLSPKKEKGELSNAFKDVDKGYGEESDEKSLVNACKKSYAKEPTEITDTTTENDNYKQLKDIWNFCTREVETIELVSTSANSSSGKISQKHGNILVNAEEGKNKSFWEIQEEAFFDRTVGETKKDGLGKQADKDSSFKTFYGNGTKNNGKTLREVCKEAYEQTASGNDEEKHTLKFCSILPNKTS